MTYTEEDAKRERVEHILNSLKATFKKFFGEELHSGKIQAAIDHEIYVLQDKFIQEALTHLVVGFDPADLFRAKEILLKEKQKEILADLPAELSPPKITKLTKVKGEGKRNAPEPH